jgi:uncharacterized protein YprB with RNaseH-like and TPR domain
MLQHTFQHIPGVGEKTEKRIWAAGLTTWQEFLDASHRAPLPRWQGEAIRFALEASLASLEKKDAAYFTQRLPCRLHWRLYPEFAQRVAYLDIETTGVSAGYSYITVIGLYDGTVPRVYVRGRNLSQFIRDIPDYTLLVTYNGRQFDLPFIRAEMGIPLPQAHIDLRYPLAALGYKGGLKKIERCLGLERQGPVALLDGWCAVLLWQYYEQGEERALETLLRYNLEDVVHLPALLAMVYNTRVQQLPFSLPLTAVAPPPPIPFAFDAPLIYRALAATGREWLVDHMVRAQRLC